MPELLNLATRPGPVWAVLFLQGIDLLRQSGLVGQARAPSATQVCREPEITYLEELVERAAAQPLKEVAVCRPLEVETEEWRAHKEVIPVCLGFAGNFLVWLLRLIVWRIGRCCRRCLADGLDYEEGPAHRGGRVRRRGGGVLE